MDTETQLKALLDEALHLGGRSASWDRNTPLLGSLPELDSLAVMNVISALERTFGFPVEDDEISAETLATLGSLSDFVAARRAAH